MHLHGGVQHLHLEVDRDRNVAELPASPCVADVELSFRSRDLEDVLDVADSSGHDVFADLVRGGRLRVAGDGRSALHFRRDLALLLSILAC